MDRGYVLDRMSMVDVELPLMRETRTPMNTIDSGVHEILEEMVDALCRVRDEED